jgi:hypothetical protein
MTGLKAALLKEPTRDSLAFSYHCEIQCQVKFLIQQTSSVGECDSKYSICELVEDYWKNQTLGNPVVNFLTYRSFGSFIIRHRF